MKNIILGRRKDEVVEVDDEDYDFLKKWKWSVNDNKRNKYAVRYLKKNNGIETLSMHRVIMGVKNQNLVVDHIDGNGLNNKRNNLRICTFYENRCNKKKPITNTSGYKGVHFKKINQKWCAQITVRGVIRHLGYFKTAKEAHEAYCRAGEKYFGMYFNRG